MHEQILRHDDYWLFRQAVFDSHSRWEVPDNDWDICTVKNIWVWAKDYEGMQEDMLETTQTSVFRDHGNDRSRFADFPLDFENRLVTGPGALPSC